MPKRTDIQSILIVGAGPIVIGQACEFDYSGVQACKALKEEGYRVILVNSNPATIMTDPGLADATYVEPITPEFLERVIERERPDALLPTMGGQTALNASLKLAELGVLERYGVEMIGAKADVIDKAEDRQRFREAMDAIGLKSPVSRMITSFDEAMDALELVGLPAIIRPSFTLGGTGGGIAYNREEYVEIVRSGLRASPTSEVLIEQSVLGWKEFEMEVVRDKADNCIIICSIENIDPMGIHTGDSVTVAPALTLTDKEYQIMRNASIACLRAIGVETGGSNVQFAVDPATGEMVVIEMNPRVSRSSALASKATGFPIAKIAAKLAVGYTLDELDNDITKVTPASFEPTIDYVVTKMPRFTFEKFKGTQALLSTSMKSVGEAMAIGRTFQESLQKAFRSMETGLSGLDEVVIPGALDEEGQVDREAVLGYLSQSVPERLLAVAQAMRYGLSVEEIHRATQIDLWFLRQIAELVDAEAGLRRDGLPRERRALLRLKSMGFSDARLAAVTGQTEAAVEAARLSVGVQPVYKRIDTCAAEFPSPTPYMYSCYEGHDWREPECEAEPSEREKVMILGGGPNRIGQGIEFDYCCVHAAYALKDAGFETIMVNCNPETVSTDYDTSDRLYFEPLTVEDVLSIIDAEKPDAVVVQLGGQTPLNLAEPLAKAGVPIAGTTPESIAMAEDREQFAEICDTLGILQPPSGIAHSAAEAEHVVDRIGLPVVVRPSFVLGGRRMRVIYSLEDLSQYVREIYGEGDPVVTSNPILIDRFLESAIEIDVDAIYDGKELLLGGIMEHVEEAGVHSGDSACVTPPPTVSDEIIKEITRITGELAAALEVRGLINIQFAVKGNEVFVLEANPRASRTVPFISKARGISLAAIAARVMLGADIESLRGEGLIPEVSDRGFVAVKEAVLPWNRFPGEDSILGPEMKSTGEVMGIGVDVGVAFGKALLAAGHTLPDRGRVFLSFADRDKPMGLAVAQAFVMLGFDLVATEGTARYLAHHAVPAEPVHKIGEGPDDIGTRIERGDIQIVVNTPRGRRSRSDGSEIRRAARTHSVPCITTIQGALAAARSLRSGRGAILRPRSLQEWHQSV